MLLTWASLVFLYPGFMVDLFENQASDLRRTYWLIRAVRSASRRRGLYRRASKEKAHLRGLGWSSELIRLYCLHLKQPRLEHRQKRYLQEFDRPIQLELF